MREWRARCEQGGRVVMLPMRASKTLRPCMNDGPNEFRSSVVNRQPVPECAPVCRRRWIVWLPGTDRATGYDID